MTKKLLLKWFNQFESNFLEDWIDVLLPFARVLLLVLLGYVVWRIYKRLIPKILRYCLRTGDGLDHDKHKRTLERLFGNLGLSIIGAVVFLESLAEFGYSIAPLLATAGVAGIAIAFGLQNVMKDIISGFLLLLEGQIREGDVVEISGKTGTVEEINLRSVRLRDSAGIVHFLPSSTIGVISNHTKQYAYAVIDLSVCINQPFENVINAIEHAAIQLVNNERYKPYLLSALEIVGLDKIDGDVMTIRFRFKTQEHYSNVIRRAMLQELKNQLDLHQIILPSASDAVP